MRSTSRALVAAAVVLAAATAAAQPAGEERTTADSSGAKEKSRPSFDPMYRLVRVPGTDYWELVWGDPDETPAPGTFRLAREAAGLLQPFALKVDAHTTSGTVSNGNGVLEAGESVLVEPAWNNTDTNPAPGVTGTAMNYTGPAGASYGIDDAASNYGTIPATSTTDCFTATSNCYQISVVAQNERLSFGHWDTDFSESLSSGDAKVWKVHVGGSFTDAATTSGLYRFIETIFHKQITGGCGTGLYCPGDPVTRQQMAVFLLVSEHGAGYNPPSCVTPTFTDVPCSSGFAKWIEQLFAEGVTGGCQVSPPMYCPTSSVTRGQMAVFLLRTKLGSSYTSPPATGIFADMPATNPLARWAEDLYTRGITGGCSVSPLNYCPNSNVTRGQMAVFLTTTFTLALYGP